MAEIKLIQGAGVAQFAQSKIGGEPALGSDVLLPLDRAGTAMNFLLQLNFDELSVDPRGILLVYTANDIDKAQAKDRKSYRLIWQPTGAPDTIPSNSQSGTPLVRNSGTANGDDCFCEVFPTELPRLKAVQEICAFSSNGVTYSEVRAKDDCYSHLIEQAPKYVPLFNLKADKSHTYLSLIHQDDLSNRMLEKAWLLRL